MNILDEFKKQIPNVQNPTNQKQSNIDVESTINDYNELYSKIEKQKFTLRWSISIFVALTLVIQLVFFDFIMWYILNAIIAKNASDNFLSPQVISELLTFLKFYISATVVELLGMVFFMVRYSFSKSNLSLNPKEKRNNKNKKK